MRRSELLWAESTLEASGLRAAGDRAMADALGPRLDEPGDRGGLAGRLARLPAAHPSARHAAACSDAGWSDAGSSDAGWSDAVSSEAGRSDAGWADAARHAAVWRTAVWRTDACGNADGADRQPGSDQARQDVWWRGESDIWWRIPDGPASEAAYDDVSGLGEPSELTDGDDVTGAGGAGEAGGPDEAGGSDDADGPGGTEDQGGGTGGRAGRTARRTPEPPGRGHGQPDGEWGGTGSLRAGRDYWWDRPWFSPDGSGDPWFAASPDYQADS